VTVFHWVRHGPTHAKSFAGWRDIPADLSDTDQVTRLDAFLPRQAVLVSSDLTRCVQTADVLAAGRLRITPRPGLREFNFGAWDGVPFDEVAARWPDLSRAYWERPGDLAPPGGESWNTAMARVSAAADDLGRRHPDQHIIVVAHLGAILTQIQRALGCNAADVLAHRIENLSVTEIDLRGQTPEVRRINHIP